ncbi:MAG: murein biosynthesis integral membrane protein MurJ [Nitrospirae bacterium]|nr:murein biosynthesis integral membrane protein MurJ [Nitrospirota bacterium]MBF0535479.1 murein biosynthesis integral membrane protein MurJ [Nitrospirota bacterium]MBF0617389.1 murein biosynthesis integral membrane protein MurJ [Nitrospirota bacterium]
MQELSNEGSTARAVEPSSSGKIARSAFSMSVATSLSRLLGFVRDMLVARVLGASDLSDSFFVAFRIPNLMRELFAEGSMSSGLIPVLTEIRTKDGDAEAALVVRKAFTFVVIFIGIFCALGVVFAPQIVSAIAPGFLQNIVKFKTTIMLTRIMFPFLLCVSIAALVMGALNTKRVFFIPALASAWFNIAIIAAIAVFTAIKVSPAVAVALGVTIGGVVQFLWQLPTFFKHNYSLKPSTGFNHKGLKRMGKLILPATVGTAVAQVNIFVSTILASFLPVGSITYLYYSMRLIQFPVGVFGVAVGMAALPALSEHAAKKDFEALAGDFAFSLKLLFSVTVPSMLGLIALSKPIVAALFEHGKFGPEAVKGTATALICYSLGIWAMVGVRVLTASFYSLQDTRTPVKSAVLSLTLNVLLSLTLMGPFSYLGLALANAGASAFNFSMLFFLLKKRLSNIDFKGIAVSFGKTLAASVIMGVFGYFLTAVFDGFMVKSHLVKAWFLFVTIAASTGVYFGAALILKSNEVGYFLRTLKRRWNKKK